MFGKKRAIRKYAQQLPKALYDRYGVTQGCTEAQVVATVTDLGLSRRYIDYALAMFCAEHVLVEQGLQGERLHKLSGAIATAGLGGGYAAAGGFGTGGGFGGCGGDSDGGGGGDSC